MTIGFVSAGLISLTSAVSLGSVKRAYMGNESTNPQKVKSAGTPKGEQSTFPQAFAIDRWAHSGSLNLPRGLDRWPYHYDGVNVKSDVFFCVSLEIFAFLGLGGTILPLAAYGVGDFADVRETRRYTFASLRLPINCLKVELRANSHQD